MRVNFNYFIDDDTFDYIARRRGAAGRRGRRLLPHYRFEPDTGLWKHRDGLTGRRCRCTTCRMPTERCPTTVARICSPMAVSPSTSIGPGNCSPDLADAPASPIGLPDTTADFEHLRWFPYPDEA